MIEFEADAPAPQPSDDAAADYYSKISPGAVAAIGSQVMDGPTMALYRAAQRGQYADASSFDRTMGSRNISDEIDESSVYGGADTSSTVPTGIKQTLLPADEINKRFAPQGPDGKQTPITDRPMSEGLAQTIADQKKAEIERNAVWARYAGNHNVLTNFGTGTVAFMLDPLNIGSMFVPGIGEEAILSGAGRIGLEGVAGRTAARLGAGATSGAAQQGVLSALKYGLGTEEASDYDLRSAFKDMAFGAAFGAVAHAGFGGLREAGILKPDHLMAGPNAAEPMPEAAPADVVTPPGAETVTTASLAQREAAMRAGTAQVAEGRPVDVAPIFQQPELAPDLSSFDAADFQKRIDVRARSIDSESFDQADSLDQEIAVHRAQLNRILAVRDNLQAEPTEVAQDRVASLERQVSESAAQRSGDDAASLQALRDRLDTFTGKRRSSPTAKALREQIAQIEENGPAPLPDDHPEVQMQAEINRLRDQSGQIRDGSIQRNQDAEVRARLALSDAAQRRGAVGPRINAARQQAEAEAAAMGFSRHTGSSSETLSSDLTQRASAIMRSDKAIDHASAVEQAAISRAPEDVRNEAFGSATREGRGDAAREGSGSIIEPVAESELPAAGDRFRQSGEGGDGGTGSAVGAARGRGGSSVDLDQPSVLTADALAQKQAQLREAGFAPGIPQPEFDAATQRLYGPKDDVAPVPAVEAKAPKTDALTGATVDPEMDAIEQRVMASPHLTPEDRALIEAANAEVQAAALREQAFSQAGECLTAAGI